MRCLWTIKIYQLRNEKADFHLALAGVKLPSLWRMETTISSVSEGKICYWWHRKKNWSRGRGAHSLYVLLKKKLYQRSTDKLWWYEKSNSSFKSESSPLLSCKITRLDNCPNLIYKQFLKVNQNGKLLLWTCYTLTTFCKGFLPSRDKRLCTSAKHFHCWFLESTTFGKVVDRITSHSIDNITSTK